MNHDILDAAVNNTWESGASFSLRHRVFRLIWNVTWLAFAAWTPPAMHWWRRAVLRAFGAKLAPTAGVYGSARVWYPPNLEMGHYAFVGPRVTVYSMGKISLGDYALASQGVHLCAGTHNIDDPHFQLRAKPIVIGARAWIAAEAFVGPGVNVGEGAVLGARGCAMRDLDPWTVYSGNPAAPIRARRRFSVE